jgi:hypothetical protein
MVNYNKLKQTKLGQIGIFVILAIIIILVLVFIISTSKLDNIDNSNTNLKNSGGDLFPLKISIDTCLETQLKTAILIAGLRGGLIYSDGERYVSSNGVNKYDPNILTNFQLNPNYLSRNLIHSQYDAILPRYNNTVNISINGEEKRIYSHSIEEDFKRFILSNLQNCLNFEELKNDYNITQNIFFGNLIRFDTTAQTLEATPFDAEIGDKISFTLDNTIYAGTVKEATMGENVIIEFSGIPFTSQTKFEDVLIINLNNSVELELIFENDNIAAKLIYPITLEQNNNKVYFKETRISVQNRMKRLMELGNYLLNEKIYNRSLDYSNQTDLQKVLNLNRFYGDSDTSDLDFEISVANNELDYKLKTISIIDNRSKLFSNPFVMNFGYENSAPKLFLKIGPYGNLTLLNAFTGYFTTQINKHSRINLREEFSLSDNQFLDNFGSYFIEQSITNTQYKFILSSEGILDFEAYQNGLYSFDIQITDGETTSIYQFTIDAGLGELGTGSGVFDSSRYELIYLLNYEVGTTDLKFIKHNIIYDGLLKLTSPIINLVLNTRESKTEESDTTLDYYDKIKINGSFSNDTYTDFEILKTGEKFAAKIPSVVVNLFTYSDWLMYHFLLNKSKPKTKIFINSDINEKSPSITIDITINHIINNATEKHFIIKLEHTYNTNSNAGADSIVKTEFPYYNKAPILSDESDIGVFTYNMTLDPQFVISPSSGTDPDRDALYWNITKISSPSVEISIGPNGFLFTPSKDGTYKFKVFQTDGELYTKKRFLEFEVVK